MATMKNPLVKLINGFENGKFDRRRLLQTLGLAATAGFAASAVTKTASAFAASAAQAAPADVKAFPVANVNHLALSSADYAKSRDFYVDLFTMRVRWDDGKRAEVQFGSTTAPDTI